MSEQFDLTRTLAQVLRCQDPAYATVWAAGRAYNIQTIGVSTSDTYIGQSYQYHKYYTRRGYIKFPLDSVPDERIVTGATLTVYVYRVYLNSKDVSSFDLAIVEHTPNEADVYDTYDNLGDESFGTVTITDSMTDETTYDITINSAGIDKINEAITNGETYLYLGLRSSRDMSALPPVVPDTYTSAEELVALSRSDLMVLSLTTANWPDDRYPDIPAFPEVGYMDIDTYAVIKAYVEDLTHFVSEVVYGLNIYFDNYADSKIYWDGTDEEITRDEIAEQFQFTSLASDSSISVCGSATIAALTNTTLTTTGNGTVTGDLSIPSPGYAAIKAQIEHDLLWWEGTGDTPSVDAGKAKIYQELSSGDLKITINSGGSTKTAILADFSAL